jgi:putative addiction module component (TIGR02574 family)
MSENARTILEAALALPEAEREEIAERLLDSLPPDINELDDEAFLAELLRRRDEMADGTDPGILWSELKKMN